MRHIVLAMALALLATPTAAAGEGARSVPRPVSGAVREVDPVARVLRVGSEKFEVPPGVDDLGQLSAGDHVVVHWRPSGGRRVVTAIERRTSAGD